MQVDELKTDLSDPNALYGGQQKVSFSSEQQEKVQSLIDEAYKRAFTKAQRSRPSEEIDRLKTEVDRLKQDKKMATLLRSISRHNVVDAEEVAELLKDRMKVEEDGSFSVIGESGASVINSSGVPMTVDEYVSSWVNERPHHLRSSGPHGAGSQGARFSSGGSRYNLSDPSVWRSMPREDLDRLLKDGITVQGAAGQTYRFKDVKNPFLEARKRRSAQGQN